MQDEERHADEVSAETDQPERPQDRRPVHRLGALGCLGMTLAAIAGIALLMSGNFYAGAAGLLLVSIALGAGGWLYTMVTPQKK